MEFRAVSVSSGFNFWSKSDRCKLHQSGESKEEHTIQQLRNGGDDGG